MPTFHVVVGTLMAIESPLMDFSFPSTPLCPGVHWKDSEILCDISRACGWIVLASADFPPSLRKAFKVRS